MSHSISNKQDERGKVRFCVLKEYSQKCFFFSTIDLDIYLYSSSTMYFGTALALILSGVSSVSIKANDHVVNSNFLHRKRRDYAAPASSSISKNGRSFAVSSSNKSKEKEPLPSKMIPSVNGSRKTRNLLLENNDRKNKDTTDVLRVVSTADSKTFEVCNDFGVVNSCSSKKDVCNPLTEQQNPPFPPKDMVMNLTDEEKTELGICLNFSPIDETNLFRRKDDASADDVADDKDTHRLSFTSEQYPLHKSDISCLYIKEKDKRQRS